MAETEDDGGGSPPCLLHELDQRVTGLDDPETRRDVARWRKSERARLITARQAIPVAARKQADLEISAELTRRIGAPLHRAVALYWPFKGEPDLRRWAEEWRAGGGRTCLPVVVRKAAPLIFRDWTGAETLHRGVWNIPIPPDSAAELVPDIVISPVVGFDAESYRLGYGGGFYDRTLAALRAVGRMPRVIGVGYSFQRIPTIYPQRHDVALDQAIFAGP